MSLISPASAASVSHAARVARTDYDVDFAETGKMWEGFKKKAGQAASAVKRGASAAAKAAGNAASVAKAAGKAAVEKRKEQKAAAGKKPGEEEPEDLQKYNRVDATWVQF